MTEDMEITWEKDGVFTLVLCICGHPSADHLRFDAGGEACQSLYCYCERYRKTAPEDRSLSAGVTPEGLARETVAESVNSESPYGEEGMTEGFND